MRVRFPRLPDHQRAYALVERDDGVVCRRDAGTAGPGLPPGIVQLVVERELRIGDGVWAGIAAVTTNAGTPAAGRPRAHMLADLVSAVAAQDDLTADGIRQLARARLAGLPPCQQADPAAIAMAARKLQVEAARWARLRVGEELRYDWPGGLRQHTVMENRPDEVIEHGPVTLHKYRTGDLEALLEVTAASADHLRPWLPWAEFIVPEAEAEFLAQAQRDWDDGTAYNYKIVAGGMLAGGVSLMARIGPGGLEIGYWVRQDRTRRGLATAAAAALVAQAFRLPGVDRVEIVHDELNVASGGIPRKLGFTEAGRRPIDPPSLAGSGVGVVWRLFKPVA